MVDLHINQETVNTGTSLVFVGIVIGDIPANLAIQKVSLSTVEVSIEAYRLDRCRYLASVPATCLGTGSHFPNLYQESSRVPRNALPTWTLRIWIHSRHSVVSHKVVYEEGTWDENGAVFHRKLHCELTEWADCLWLVAPAGKG